MTLERRGEKLAAALASLLRMAKLYAGSNEEWKIEANTSTLAVAAIKYAKAVERARDER
jgi:hypothetical protein